MGDRGNIISIEGESKIYLYTHWGGCGLPTMLRDALKKAPDRWDDSPYMNRVIFCQMTGGDTGTTGFGISTMGCDNEHDYLIVHYDTQKITQEKESGGVVAEWSIEEFSLLADGDLPTT